MVRCRPWSPAPVVRCPFPSPGSGSCCQVPAPVAGSAHHPSGACSRVPPRAAAYAGRPVSGPVFRRGSLPAVVPSRPVSARPSAVSCRPSASVGIAPRTAVRSRLLGFPAPPLTLGLSPRPSASCGRRPPRPVARSSAAPLVAFHSPSRTSSAAPTPSRALARERPDPCRRQLPWGLPPLRRARSGGSLSRPGPTAAPMIHRCSCRDAVDCSTSPTPGLAAGFHTREAPPAPFPTTLTV